jgi:hypothetical protein
MTSTNTTTLFPMRVNPHFGLFLRQIAQKASFSAHKISFSLRLSTLTSTESVSEK